MKTKVKCQCFFDGKRLTSAFIVLIKNGRQWLPLGDNGEVKKFPTREAAQAEADQVANMKVAAT